MPCNQVQPRIWRTFLQMNIMNPILLSAIFIAMISMELVFRNILLFNKILRNNDSFRTSSTSQTNTVSRKSMVKYIWWNLLAYPTYIICFSWLIIPDYYFHNGYSLILTIIWMVLYLVSFIRSAYKCTKLMYNS